MTSLRTLAERLPLMESSAALLAGVPAHAGWWTEPAQLLPVLARPQLAQELEELERYCRAERIRAVAVGSGSGWLSPPLHDETGPVLLVQPGHATLFAGPQEADRTAWFPAATTLADAERALNESGYTLSLWPEDRGTLGGNWALPRGSFVVREFLAPANRAVGVQALFRAGGWYRSSEAPRSAAGPNIGRALRGQGGALAWLTQVLVRYEPLGEWRVATTVRDAVLPLLDEVRALVSDDMAPTALTIRADGDGRVRCTWRQNVWNGWQERVFASASARLGLHAEEPPADATPPAGGATRIVPWSELRTAAAQGVPAALRESPWSGAMPEGMAVWGRPVAPSPSWQRWLGQVSDGRGVVGATR